MKISVLIIAHNEENNIKTCLESIFMQTISPSEIVLICHNCTDQTESIARNFEKVKIVKYNGPEGVPFARIKGFEEVSGDIIACLDGDSIADKNWLEKITKPLKENENISLVAGYVILTNNFFTRLTSFWQFVILRRFFKNRLNYFAWGSSFACRKIDYEKVGGISPLIELKEKLNLNFWAEDLYLSLALMQTGKIFFSLRAKNYTSVPEWKTNLNTTPIRKWAHDNRTLLEYFKNKNN